MRLFAYGFIGCVGAVLMAAFPRWTVDDAYIYYRYAENFARTGALLWNVGEDPVEGFTGVLLPLVLGLGSKFFGVSPLLMSKLIGLAAYVALGAGMLEAMRSLRVREPIRWAFFTLVVLAPMQFVHAWSGLETMAFAAGVSWCVASLLRCLEPGRSGTRWETVLPLTALATALLRPEGALLAATAVAVLGWSRRSEAGRLRPISAEGETVSGDRKTGPYDIGWFLRFTFLFVVPGALYFVWRWRTFGYPLPNTFYAKSSERWIEPRMAESLLLFATFYLLIPGGATALAWAMSRRRVVQGAFNNNGAPHRSVGAPDTLKPPLAWTRPALLGGLAFVAIVFAQYLGSLPLMNYQHRFFAPYLPMLLIAIAGIAEAALRRGERADEVERGSDGAFPLSRAPRRLVFAGTALVLAAQAAIFGWQYPLAAADARRYRTVLEDVHLRAAHLVRGQVPPDEWLVVVLDAGIVPYVSGLRTVDFGGLNDETLAHGDLNEQGRLDYLFDHRPGAIVITSRSWEEVRYTPEAERIVGDPRFADYRLAGKFRTNRTRIRARDYQFVFLRTDLHAEIGDKATSAVKTVRGEGSCGRLDG